MVLKVLLVLRVLKGLRVRLVVLARWVRKALKVLLVRKVHKGLKA
jgi:hypothetical protein